MEREPYILVKLNKTDPIFQRILVRKGEYFHPQLFRWMALPKSWKAKAKNALKRASEEAE